jgi:Zn-dependent membrane protease YugP
MGLSKQEASERQRMTSLELIAASGDNSFLVAALLRLKSSTERLTMVLIALTIVILVLTLPLSFDAARHLHWLAG